MKQQAMKGDPSSGPGSRAASVALLFVYLLLAAPASGQSRGGAVSLTVASSHGLAVGGVTGVFAEARWEPRRASVSPVLISGLRLGGNSCEDSFPAMCGLPSTGALVLGAGAAVVRRIGPADVVVTPSVRVLRWGGGWDPAVRLEGGLRFEVGQGVQLQGGGQLDGLWTGRTTGSVRVEERRLGLAGFHLGLRFETGRRSPAEGVVRRPEE